MLAIGVITTATTASNTTLTRTAYLPMYLDGGSDTSVAVTLPAVLFKLHFGAVGTSLEIMLGYNAMAFTFNAHIIFFLG